MNGEDKAKAVITLFANALEKSMACDLNEASLAEIIKGGPGSGHHGHSGRKGKVGGSAKGGIQVGRAGAPDAPSQYKFSGSHILQRPRGTGVSVKLSSAKTKGKLSISGDMDEKGKGKKDHLSLRVNGKKVALSHDEVHTLRSMARFSNKMNKGDIKTIAGKEIARGTTMEVEVGGKKVNIPVNDETVAALDAAVKGAKDLGYSMVAESPKEIEGLVSSMRSKSPITVLRNKKISKAGQLAAFIQHSTAHADEHLHNKVNAWMKKTKKGLAAKKTVAKIFRDIKEARGSGHKAAQAMSGTQAIKHYRRAAIKMTALMRRVSL